MPQSLSNVLVHLIFSTKDRYPFITPEIEPELYAYLATTLRTMRSPSIAINGVEDHLHILLSLARTTTIAALVEEIKTETSKWIKRRDNAYRNFHWQRGYGAFSIGQSEVPALKRYIAGQEEHHKRVTFQEEHRKFLNEYGIEYDERYVWD